MLTTFHMYRFLITYAMAAAQNKLDDNGQLLDPADDVGNVWWTLSSLFWPTAPDWFRNMFTYQDASAGMTLN